MLLASAWWRLLFAGAAVAALWAAVLWVAPSTPSISLAQPAVRLATAPSTGPVELTGGLRAVVRSGAPAPGGGRFDRFDAPSQPVLAPVNARGQVAFYASILHSPVRDGIFLADAGQVRKVAAYGDAVPGGGTLAEFGAHPLPALNAAGHVAFVGDIAGGRATQGVFLVGADGLQTIALAGDDAPAIPPGVLVGFDPPSLNDNDEMTFVAEVRRGRDTLDVLYFWNGRRLQRVAAEGDRLLRTGGVMDKIGGAALNNSGVIAFPAAIFKGPTPGGIFVAGARDLRLLASAGDQAPGGNGMILRFSERAAIDDSGAVTFGGYVGVEGQPREAVLWMAPEGLSAVAVEGGSAPGGGRFAGFGPWPTVASDGSAAFIAALDGASGPLAAFAGPPGDIKRLAVMGQQLTDREKIGQFALNAIAAAGPGGALSFVTVAHENNENSAIYCRCPAAASR
jgi:hypothetical protein